MGYEDLRNYRRTELVFLDIDNIHKMRESMERLVRVAEELSCPDIDAAERAKMVAGTKWLYHVGMVLRGTATCVERLRQGAAVLVHCSDGWDRTSQIASLVQVVLDPFYRTLVGLTRLIDKDWVAFGHKFQDRCRHLCVTESTSEYSPIFVQFLDALWQLLRTTPAAFEYTEALLLEVAHQVYSCFFGNFRGNTAAPPVPPADSLWRVLGEPQYRAVYINPEYSPDPGDLPLDAVLASGPALWDGLYVRYARYHSVSLC